MPEADAEGGLVFWGVGPPTNECPGRSYPPRANRLIYPLYEPIAKNREPFAASLEDGDPAPPCPTLPLPPAKKKERPACLQAGRRRQEGAGGVGARRPRRGGAGAAGRARGALARGGG